MHGIIDKGKDSKIIRKETLTDAATFMAGKFCESDNLSAMKV